MWWQCFRTWGPQKPLGFLAKKRLGIADLPTWVSDEECKRLIAWLDSLEIREIQELEKIYKGFQPVENGPACMKCRAKTGNKCTCLTPAENE
jgi:hypothetical protein